MLQRKAKKITPVVIGKFICYSIPCLMSACLPAIGSKGMHRIIEFYILYIIVS